MKPKKPTDRQLDFLISNNIKFNKNITRYEASLLIGEFIEKGNRATDKQLDFLKRNNITHDPKITKKEAWKLINNYIKEDNLCANDEEYDEEYEEESPIQPHSGAPIDDFLLDRAMLPGPRPKSSPKYGTLEERLNYWNDEFNGMNDLKGHLFNNMSETAYEEGWDLDTFDIE